MKSLKYIVIALAVAAFGGAGCSGDDEDKIYTVDAYAFASAVDSNTAFVGTKVMKANANQPSYFVFYDAGINEYVALNIGLIQSAAGGKEATALTLNEVAKMYRQAADLGQPVYGMDIVTFDGTNAGGVAFFRSTTSGILYEDSSKTKDVELMNANSEEVKIFAKASGLSVRYQMNIESSIKVALLGDKVSKMLQERNGELTAADKAAVTGEALGIAGISVEDLGKAALDPTDATADQLLEKAANSFGTTPANLRDRILPELTGVKF